MHGPRCTDHAFALPSPVHRSGLHYGTSSSSSHPTSTPSYVRSKSADHKFFRSDSGTNRLQDNSSFIEEILDIKDTNRGLQLRQQAVKKIPYFSEMEKIMPGFSDRVADKAEFVPACSGTVLFRQGDPAICSYFIASGKVAVFERDPIHQHTRPRTPEYKGKEVMKGCLTRFCKAVKSKLSEKRDIEPQETDIAQSKNLYKRRHTLDGFSTYCSASELGKQKLVLYGGDMLDDAASLSAQEKRHRSAVCLENCELVRLQKGSFDVDLAEKIRFFYRHVPGFQDIKINHQQEHPIFAFEDRVFKRGTTLLEEGLIAKPSIFIIREGAVSFRRSVRAKLGTIGGKKHRCWKVMKDKDMFSSLGMLGVGNLETCTAVVTSKECFCYVLSGSTTQDFGDISKELITVVLEHVRHTMKPLLQLSTAFCGVDAIPAPGINKVWGGVLGYSFPRLLASRQSRTSKIYVAPRASVNSEDSESLSVRGTVY